MASTKALPGYRGIAVIDNRAIRCESFDINPNQEVLFYDHVIGLNDTIPTNSSTKGESVGNIQIQKTFLRPSTIKIEGNLSFTATHNGLSVNFASLFNYAKYGDYFDTAFTYFCNAARGYKNCRINSFGFSATAGDVLNINTNIIAGDLTTASETSYIVPEKVITYEKVSISNTGFDNIMGFSFDINNSAEPIYTNDSTTGPLSPSNKFLPYDIRLGMQAVTGEITIYLYDGMPFISGDPVTITVSVADWSTTMKIIYLSNKITGQTKAVTTTIPFVGVDKVFGD